MTSGPDAQAQTAQGFPCDTNKPGNLVADGGFVGDGDDKFMYYYDPENRLMWVKYDTDDQGSSGTMVAAYRCGARRRGRRRVTTRWKP